MSQADQDELSGLAAVVTGGASGIGFATARFFARRGARVAVLDLNRKAPANCVPIVCDLQDGEAVEEAIAQATDHLGGLDLVVNNAAIALQGTVTDHEDAEWHRVFDVNVVGIVRVMRSALPHLRRSSHASVVNTCSVAATLGLQRRALYSATKGAVHALTLAMAADLVADGIRVNCVSPATVDTPWIEQVLAAASDPESERAALVARQPIGRLVSADEVANAIAYLAGPGSASTTGTVLFVDGGMQSVRPHA